MRRSKQQRAANPSSTTLPVLNGSSSALASYQNTLLCTGQSHASTACSLTATGGEKHTKQCDHVLSRRASGGAADHRRLGKSHSVPGSGGICDSDSGDIREWADNPRESIIDGRPAADMSMDLSWHPLLAPVASFLFSYCNAAQPLVRSRSH